MRAGGRIVPALALAATIAAAPGCLQRRIRVVTDPPGATVWLNEAEIGRSPAETDFTFFGRYDVRIARDGYETINTTRRARAPWYEYPFIDLLAIILPFNVETKLEWTFRLEPEKRHAGTEEEGALLERGAEMRRAADAPRGREER